MKKFLAICSLILTMFLFVSCIADEEEDFDDFVDTENGNSGTNPGNDNSGESSNQDNTQESDNGDTGSSTNPDPAPADPTDSDSDPNDNQGGNQDGYTDNSDTGTGNNDTETGDNTDTGSADTDTDTDTGNEEEEVEEDDTFDYDKCTEITLDTTVTYDTNVDLGLFTQGIDCQIYFTYYTPRTGSDSKKKDSLNFEFYNLTNFNGTYNLAGKNYSSYSGLFLVVFEDGGAKKYIQRKGTVKVTASNNDMTAELSDVFLEEVTIDNSTHKTTVVPDGACLKINDTTVSD